MRPGFRTNGPKKMRLIDMANIQMMELGAKGVNVRRLLKLLGIEGNAHTITTKQWSGVIGALKQFRRSNKI